MSFKAYFDEKQQMVYTRISDVLTTSEVREFNLLIADQPDANRMLFDGTRMRMFDVAEDYLEHLGERLATELPVRYRAIVVSDRFCEQMETFARFASNGFRNVRVFTDIGSACHWLLLAEAGHYTEEAVGTELVRMVAAEEASVGSAVAAS